MIETFPDDHTPQQSKDEFIVIIVENWFPADREKRSPTSTFRYTLDYDQQLPPPKRAATSNFVVHLSGSIADRRCV